MYSINRIELIGNVGAEVTSGKANGKTWARFSVATHERWTDSAGERHEHTEWTRVVCWGTQAENAVKYIRKGSYLRVEGALRGTQYEDKDTNVTRYGHEVRAFDIGLLDPPPAAASTGRHSRSMSSDMLITGGAPAF
jgi:single-strand DNA-binding protein